MYVNHDVAILAIYTMLSHTILEYTCINAILYLCDVVDLSILLDILKEQIFPSLSKP